MPHLFTSNFKLITVLMHRGGWALFLIGLLILAEFSLRISAVQARLPAPEPTLWHSPQAEAKLDYLRRFEVERGIDVLFIGNSTVQAGLDPEAFDQARGISTDKRPGAFNGGLDGMPPYGVRLFLEIYLQDVQPELIIYGVTPQDLNANSPWSADVTDQVDHAPLIIGSTKRGISGKLASFFLQHSQLYRYHFVLHQFLLGNMTHLENTVIYFDTRGYNALQQRLSDIEQSDRSVFVNRAGVLNYEVGSKQLEAFLEIIDYIKSRDIELILVNMPLADDYYKNFDHPADYEIYFEALTAIAREKEVDLYDFELSLDSERFNDIYFSDFNHLNQAGAEKLSQFLGQNLKVAGIVSN